MADVTLERALTFECEREELVAIFSEPSEAPRIGLIVLVGGPQYRVGSHRQFLLLARRLAQNGIVAMRFDFRGMGDSTGFMRNFESVIADIAGAIDRIKASYPSIDQIVLWGLCDAASAALLYWHATADSRVTGMVLLNPWVRSEQSLAKVHLKHYYPQRFLDWNFWKKLGSGRINMAGVLQSFARNVVLARRNPTQERVEARFQNRMMMAMESFLGPVLIILSGQDLTAIEFAQYCESHPRWQTIATRARFERCSLSSADHTFSTSALRNEVELLTLDWLRRSYTISACDDVQGTIR